jgi:hypothetical protein
MSVASPTVELVGRDRRRSLRRAWLLPPLAVCALAAAALAVGGSSALDPDAIRSATAGADRAFGSDPITLTLRADVASTLSPDNLQPLLALEQRLAGLRGVVAVTGPATFLSAAAIQVDRAIARDITQSTGRGNVTQRISLASELVRFGYSGMPSLTNPSFVGQMVLGSGTAPRPALAWLFPDEQASVVLVRPRTGLDQAQIDALVAQVRRAAAAADLIGVSVDVSPPASTAGLRRLRIAVSAPDVTAAPVIGWLQSLEGRVLSLDYRLRAGPTLTDALTAYGTLQWRGGATGMLALMPSGAAAPLLTPDHRRTELAFVLPAGSAEDQAALVQRIARLLRRAPAGVSATPVGAEAEYAASIAAGNK